MKPTKKINRGWDFTAILLFLALLVTSCKYDLVKEPTHNFNEKKNAADYKDYILPPSVVSASHGLSHVVKLEWETVPNAVQYYIYSAATPYDVFQKVSETKENETEISIDEEAGITKYYCVCAVNYYGTVSSKSIVVSGSTLAVPIITEITPSEEGTCLTVNWWMDNCNRETYADFVSYNISVYESATSNVVSKSVTVNGLERSVLIDGLVSKKEYFFVITVINNNDTKVSEKSDKTSAQTAHRVVPDAPLDFTAGQGESIENIELKWTLPPKAWYKENSGVSGFVPHRLYFKIYRKLAGQSDNEFVLVHTEHIADEYVPGTIVSWQDAEGIETVRGKKYVYYVQSITDDTPEGKTITADSSKTSTVEGWLVSVPVFSIQSDYNKEYDETLGKDVFTKISFAYKILFETYGKSYDYYIERTKYTLPTQSNPNSVIDPDGAMEVFRNSLSSITSLSDVFDNPQLQMGYYTYKLYICPAGSSGKTDFLIKVDAEGKYLVTDDADAVPEIESFSVADGYSNKFILSWTYHSDYKYIIHWNGNESNELVDETKLTFETRHDDTMGDVTVAVYNHDAQPGDRRTYTLEASLGLSSLSTPSDAKGTPIVFETLGKVQPKVTAYDYDKLLVEWPAVQKSNGTYSVSAKYDKETTELVINNDDDNDNITIQDPEDSFGLYKCIIEKPSGYDDALKSGKTIKLTVSTTNDTTHDETTSEPIDVCTVGPALTDVSVAEIKYADRIDVKWNPVTGADGYLIRRIVYKTSTFTEGAFASYEVAPSVCDVYYYDGTSLSINGETVSSDRAEVNLVNGKLKLTDKYKEKNSDLSSYEINQSFIGWGIPYGYVVIPVRNGGSKNDFEFVERNIKHSQESLYANIQENRGATFGYGLNVHSEKSESGDTQVVKWTIPYGSDESPSIYYRISGSSNNEWHKIQLVTLGQIENGKQTASFNPTDKTEAFEYLVAYKKTVSLLSNVVPVSFVNDTFIGLSYPDNVYNFNGQECEKSNKGYLLAINYSADTGPDYSEIAAWDEWDYSARSIGPTEAYVRIRNYNLSSNWYNVAKLDKDLHFVESTGPEDTLVSQYNNAISIKVEPDPVKMFDGTMAHPVTKGPLMVLRDAKHYYSIELKRGDKSAVFGDDDSVYAYRNISQKELVKCALLNMAYGFYLNGGGLADLSNSGTQFKYIEKNPDFIGTGSVSFGKRKESWESGLKYKADVTLKNFAPLQLTPAGTYSCIVAISMTDVSTRTRGLADAYLDKFRTENFTVTVSKNDTKMPASYSGTFTMSCTWSDNLLVKIGSTEIVNTSNTDVRRVYFPIQLGDEHFWGKSVNYGWWTE